MPATPKNPIHDVVRTRINVLTATAMARVAALESSERQTPSLSGTSNTRLGIARRISENRAIAVSWAEVLLFATTDPQAPAAAAAAAAAAAVSSDSLTFAEVEDVIGKAFAGKAPRASEGYAEGWNDALAYLRTVFAGMR